jgi:hypothetical protein
MWPRIWIGRIEAYYTDSETPSAWKPAFANVTTWARDADELSQKCSRMLESYGWSRNRTGQTCFR